LNHGDDVELDQETLADVILADDRVLDPDWNLTGCFAMAVVLATTSPMGTFHLFPFVALLS
jgi:hypothetical protein